MNLHSRDLCLLLVQHVFRTLTVINHRRQAIRSRNKMFRGRKSLAIVALALIASSFSLAATAGEITGTVRNPSTGQAPAGDDVILLRLEQGMQEESRTKTDAQGAFRLNVQDPNKAHLVRVMHQGVNYDLQIGSDSTRVTIDVFDAASKVQGVTGNIEILRMGNNGKLLHVSDFIEVKNDSSPPLTQAGPRTFEVYLPKQAKLSSVMAAGPSRMGVLISAAPVAGERGHYTINFPLRPGSSKFAFNYDLPYDGHAAFRPRIAYPTRQFSVMIPPTMKFSSPSPAFQTLPVGNDNFQVEAVNEAKAGELPGFEVSGAGAPPPMQAQSKAPSQPQVAVPSAPAPAAAGDSRAPAQTANAVGEPSASSSRLQWWVLGGSGVLVLGAMALLIWRKQRLSNAGKSSASQPPQPEPTSVPLLEALKEELFQLETDRLHGAISSEEYDSAKQALEGTVKRALQRAAAKS